jgi:toxin YoeB
MAKEIKWTAAAVRDRLGIYQFWLEKNQNDRYSEKLESLFYEAARILAEFPELGTRTDLAGMRVKVVKDYKLFYLTKDDSITIIRVWDTRQDPAKLKG